MTPQGTLLIYFLWGVIDVVLWLYDWKVGLSWLISGLMMPQLTEEAMVYVNHTLRYRPPQKPTNDDHP